MKSLSALDPRAIARLAACLLMIAVGVVASLPLPAQAHVLLLRSDPADGSVLKEAPTRAVFEFNQPLAPTAYVILTGPDGPLTTGPVKVQAKTLTLTLPKVTDGRYRLAYRVISASGHPLTNSISYVVGKIAPRTMKQPPRERSPDWIAATGVGAVVLLGIGAGWFVVRRKRQRQTGSPQ